MPGGAAVRPGWSTEGQTRLRARRRAWPSVPIGLVPKIRVVRVDLSSQAQVQRTAARRGDRLITNSPCRSTMSPGRRSVQPDHRRTPKAAVPWGGSFCFPLMAPRVTPDMGQLTILNKFAHLGPLELRSGPWNFETARRELSNGTLIIPAAPSGRRYVGSPRGTNPHRP